MSTRLQNLLQVLSDGAWKSNSELVRAGCGFRYGAVIEVARKLGHNIEAKKITQKHWDYRLKPGVYKQPEKVRCNCCGQILKHGVE